MKSQLFRAFRNAQRLDYASEWLWAGSQLVHLVNSAGQLVLCLTTETKVSFLREVLVREGAADKVVVIDLAEWAKTGHVKERKELQPGGHILFCVGSGSELFKPEVFRRTGGGFEIFLPPYALDCNGANLKDGDVFATLAPPPGEYRLVNEKDGCEASLSVAAFAYPNFPAPGTKTNIVVTPAGFQISPGPCVTMTGLVFTIRTDASVRIVAEA